MSPENDLGPFIPENTVNGFSLSIRSRAYHVRISFIVPLINTLALEILVCSSEKNVHFKEQKDVYEFIITTSIFITS